MSPTLTYTVQLDAHTIPNRGEGEGRPFDARQREELRIALHRAIMQSIDPAGEYGDTSILNPYTIGQVTITEVQA